MELTKKTETNCSEYFFAVPQKPASCTVFINIGRADLLGSGVRNLYEYTKVYSGGEPELIDGDVFKAIVPLDSSFNGVNNKTVLNDNEDYNCAVTLPK